MSSENKVVLPQTYDDLEAFVGQRFKPVSQSSNDYYFLLKVEKIAYDPKNRDIFHVLGERVDTGEKVQVKTQKSSSGQLMPEVGGIMRADKAQKRNGQSKSGATPYDAAYFYSYSDNRADKSFCLNGMIRATIPQLDNGMWSARVQTMDLENSYDVSAASLVDGSIDDVIAKALRPWENQAQNKVNFDASGNFMWGDGENPVFGASPRVTIRFGGQGTTFWGPSSVRAEGYTEDNKVFRLPTYEETKAAFADHKGLKQIKSVLAGLKAEEVAHFPVTVIHGASFDVGRDSLSGSNENYLKAPSQFRYAAEVKGNDGQTKIEERAGWREGIAHIKSSRSGRLIVVDTVRAGGELSQVLPLTPQELARKNGTAPMFLETAAPAQQSAPKQQPAPAPKQQPAQQPAPVQQQMMPEQPPVDDYADYADYAQDLDDIASMSDDFFGNDMVAAPEPELADDYLEQQMAAARKRGPRM